MTSPHLRVAALVALTIPVLACEERGATATATATATAVATAAPIDLDDPEACKACHQAIVAEWEESMHARAHHARDPIYAGVRRLRANKEGEAITKACAHCHHPRALDDPGSAVAKRGVGCASCHAVAEIKDGAHGAVALVATEGNLLLGPHDVAEDQSSAHATGEAPGHMKQSDQLCNACHEQMKSPKGPMICATGLEHAELEGAKRCVDCHMPEEKGPSGTASARTSHRSHRFLGPHGAWYQKDLAFLRTAVALKAQLEPGKLTVTLDNQSQHAMPTGFPGRMAMVLVEGKAEGSDDVTYRSEGEVDEAVLQKVYVDAEGNRTLAPFAEELKSDTRLKPGETRTLTFELPKSITEARVKLVFRLLPPPLAEKLGLKGEVEAEPKTVIDEVVRVGS